MAGAQGVATLTFTDPLQPTVGANIATATVTGQAGLLATHAIDAWVQGSDSTADFTSHEHKHLPVKVAVTNVVPGVGFDVTAYSDLRLTGDFKVRWVWTDNATTGAATINFGAGFGSDAATVTVTGITALTAGSNVQAWVQGTDSTADNTAYEHTYIPIRLRVTDKVAGAGFTIRAQSDFRLTGDFKVRYAYTT
jgi:hypothetical protein